MSPLRANKINSSSVAILLAVITSLIKSCEAQRDGALVAVSIPLLIMVFCICAFCWLTCAAKVMREAAPSDDQTARRADLTIFAITPFYRYRQSHLLPSRPSHSIPHLKPATSITPHPRSTANQSANVPNAPTRLAIHDPYDPMPAMDAYLHHADSEAPPGYEEAIKMTTVGDALNQLIGESDC